MSDRQGAGFQGILQAFQNVVASIVASLSVVVASGFVVFHASLSRYTDLHAFSVTPTYYLVAGISLLVTFAAILLASWGGYQLGKAIEWLSSKIFSNESALKRILSVLGIVVFAAYVFWALTQQGTLFIVLLLLATVAMFALVFALSGLKANEAENNKLKTLLGVLIEPGKALAEVARRPLTMTTVFVLLISLFYVVFIGSIYGRQVYSLIPSQFGGGQPSTVIIALKEIYTAEHFGLSRGEEGQTDMLCLLTTLVDGILVHDPDEKKSALITAEAVSGVIDTLETINCSVPLS